MAPKKSKRDVAVETMADLLIGHMEDTMTPPQAKAMLKDVKAFSQAPRRASRRGKRSQAAKSADSRPLSHVHAGSHKLPLVA